MPPGLTARPPRAASASCSSGSGWPRQRRSGRAAEHAEPGARRVDEHAVEPAQLGGERERVAFDDGDVRGAEPLARSPAARGRGPGAARPRRHLAPASCVAFPPGAAHRSSVRSPCCEPTTSPASWEPTLCGQTRPGRERVLVDAVDVQRAGELGIGPPPPTGPRRRRVQPHDELAAARSAPASARAPARRRARATRRRRPSPGTSAAAPPARGVASGSAARSGRRPSASRRSTAFVNGTARSSRARRDELDRLRHRRVVGDLRVGELVRAEPQRRPHRRVELAHRPAAERARSRGRASGRAGSSRTRAAAPARGRAGRAPDAAVRNARSA